MAGFKVDFKTPASMRCHGALDVECAQRVSRSGNGSEYDSVRQGACRSFSIGSSCQVSA
jgi:hypothetical protein